MQPYDYQQLEPYHTSWTHFLKTSRKFDWKILLVMVRLEHKQTASIPGAQCYGNWQGWYLRFGWKGAHYRYQQKGVMLCLLLVFKHLNEHCCSWTMLSPAKISNVLSCWHFELKWISCLCANLAVILTPLMLRLSLRLECNLFNSSVTFMQDTKKLIRMYDHIRVKQFMPFKMRSYELGLR